MQLPGNGTDRPGRQSHARCILAVGQGWRHGSFADALDAGRLGQDRLDWRERLSEALEPIEHGSFDALLLELDPIEMDGAGTIATTGRLAPSLALIALVSDDTAGEQALGAGAQDYVCAEDLDVSTVARSVRHARRLKHAELELAHQSPMDALTGLPTRALLQDRLDRAHARSERAASSIAVMFVGLDRYGLINETLGYRTGDRVLTEVARRLEGAIRSTDTVARFGGDVFFVLCEEIEDGHEAIAIAERAGSALAAPFRIDGREVFLTASIGVAGPTAPTHRAEALMGEAEAAMCRAKQDGGARYQVVDDAMQVRFAHRVDQEGALGRALGHGELRVFYQPQWSLEHGQIIGVEALVRWEHPRLGLLTPDHFIDLAEQTGLIVPIGDWVLREASAQAARWRDARPDAAPLQLSVNLSLRQFTQPSIVDSVAHALRDSGLAPSELSLEITETVILQDQGSRLAALLAVNKLGVPLAIDDFGTGYASMCWLKRFPVAMLKIDRSFVAGLPRDQEDSAIVAALINLGHALELRVVAEGVETREQLEELHRMGCREAQGFHLAHPQPAAAITALLLGDARLPAASV